MALQVWLPLNKDLKNNGLSNSTVINSGATLTDNGVLDKCYNLVLGNYLGIDAPNVNNHKYSKISLALWVYPTQNDTASHEILGCWQNGGGGLFLRSKQILCNMYIGGTYIGCSSSTITLNTWHHVCFTYDKTVMRLYLDGQQVSTVNASGTITYDSTCPWQIGGNPTSTSFSTGTFAGKINDVRIYDNCLTEADVKRIYNCKIMDVVSTSHNSGFFYDNSGLLINDLVSTGVTYSGNSMYFNGLSTTGGTQIRTKDGTSGLNISGGTLSIWFTPLSKPSDYRILYIDSTSHFAIGFYSSGNLFLCQCNGVSNASFSTSNIQYGQINNAIIGYATNGKPQYCYINGVKASTGTSDCWTETNGLTIGGRTANATTRFNGYISKVTVYRNQLTEEESIKIYKEGRQNEIYLPYGYTRLEYIQSTGTQYIDTNFNPSNNTRVVTELMPTTNDNAMGFFGTYPNNDFSTSSYGLYYSSSVGLAYSNFNSDSSFDRSKIEYGKKHFVDKNKNLLYIDNELVLTHTSATFQSTIPLHIFKLNFSSNPRYAKLRVYDFKIYENNDLVRHFIPSKRNSDSSVGMYDIVTNTFFENQGTGTFTAGPEYSYRLPREYQEVEYLESADGVNCYIDTNFKPNNNTRLTTTVYPTSNNSSAHFYFGSRNGSSTSQAFGVYQNGNKNQGLSGLWNNSGNISLGTNFSGQTQYYIDLNKNVLTINGVVAKTFTDGTFTGTYNVFLFAMNTTGTMDSQKGGQRMDVTKIYDNGVLVRNMIPCYRKSDSVKGMYDTVNGVFYTNKGSGDFTCGPKV